MLLIFTVCVLINTQQASACIFMFYPTAEEAFESNDVVFSGVNKGCHVSGDKKFILYEVDKIWKGKKYNHFRYSVKHCPSEIEDNFLRKIMESYFGQKSIKYSKYKNQENPTHYLYTPTHRCSYIRSFTLTYGSYFEYFKSFFNESRSEAQKELEFLGEPIYKNEGE